MSVQTFDSSLTLFVGAVLVCAVAVLWLSAVRAVVRVLAVQGLALGAVAAVLGLHLHDAGLVATAAVVVAVKAVLIPVLLRRIGSGDATERERRPLVNVPASLVVSAVLILLAFASTHVLTNVVAGTEGSLVPVGFATLLIGFFVLVVRRRPIFQIVGLLLVDNGIVLVAFLVTAGVPFLIELGVTLDVLLGVVVLMVLAQRLHHRVRRDRPRRAVGVARLMLVVLILVLPALGALVSAAARWRPWAARTAVGTNAAMLALAIVLCVRVVRHGALGGFFGVLRADALSAFMVVVIGAIAVLASWLGVRTIAAELETGRCTERRATLYAVLVQVFVTTMVLAVLAANLGVLWLGVEATTVATTFLVGHHRTKASLEASWKYIVICSVGIALAFLGTVLVYLAAIHAGGHSAHALDWTSLMAHAHRLDPSVMRLAFALVVLGYGTKVGLAPMHSWLPDAHSQAPAPISALMSGVLLTVAFYAILRFKAICDLSVGVQFARTLLVIVALLSLAVAASLLLAQRDYKRMLAYSQHRAHGTDRLGRSRRHSTRYRRRLVAHPWPRPDQERPLPHLGPDLGGRGHQPDRRRAGSAGPASRPRRRLRCRALGPLGIPAVQPLRQRARHVPSRVRGRLGLGRRRRHGGHDGHLHRHGEPRPPHAARSRRLVREPKCTRRFALAPLVGGLAVCAAIGVFAWPLTSLLEAAARSVAL